MIELLLKLVKLIINNVNDRLNGTESYNLAVRFS